MSELRVSASMAANEDRLAERIADASAGQVAALTAAMGPVDIARRQLPEDAAPGRPDWPGLIGPSMGRARILSAKWREREARMSTRSSIIPALRGRGVSTHDWLRTARAETEEPLLIVPAE